MGTQFIQFECIALNINYSTRKDNEGLVIKDEEVIKKDGNLAYKSTLPYKVIVAALKKFNIPLVKSFYAGTYLCNNIFYHLMYFSRKYDIPLAGFIHVPPTPECFKNYSRSSAKFQEINLNPSQIRPTYACIKKPAISLTALKMAVKVIVKACIDVLIRHYEGVCFSEG